ncbi:MAG: AzlC family ABC transporter permease [Candidatus Limnocylindria bacterium]
MDRRAARAALVEGWPIFVTALVVGVPFGIAARAAGLDAIHAAGMSLLIFAGAAQFAAVDLIGRGAAAPLVVVTVLLVNLRHLLMAAALRPYVAGRSVAERAAIAYLLTDEAFAMGIGWFRRGHREVAYYVVFGAALWLSWNVATIAGALAGAGIVEPRRFGLDFAITATFVSIVVLGLRGRADLLVGALALAAAGALALAGASVLAVVAAGALAPLAVFAFPRRRDQT